MPARSTLPIRMYPHQAVVGRHELLVVFPVPRHVLLALVAAGGDDVQPEEPIAFIGIALS